MKGELPMTPPPSLMWQPSETGSTSPLLMQKGHDYEELPATRLVNFPNDYLTTIESLPPSDPAPSRHQVPAGKMSVSNSVYGNDRKRSNPLYDSAPATTTAKYGSIVLSIRVLTVILVLVALVAIAAFLLAFYSFSQLMRTNNMAINQTGSATDDHKGVSNVGLQEMKAQIQQLQRENLVLSDKVAKLFGIDTLTDNSSLRILQLVLNNTQIVESLSGQVLELMSSSAKEYSTLSNQSSNFSTTLARLVHQQQVQESSWINQLTALQNNLTSRIEFLAGMPGTQTTRSINNLNTSECTMRNVTSGTSMLMPTTETKPVNMQVDHPGMLLTAVTCTTNTGTSALLNIDASSTNYYCTCSGTSSPSATNRHCFMFYWLCPRSLLGDG